MNVFTPVPSQSRAATPLPVMIFITGGNFQFLDASAPIYESERFVNTTNTVLVFIQYRLGKNHILFMVNYNATMSHEK